VFSIEKDQTSSKFSNYPDRRKVQADFHDSLNGCSFRWRLLENFDNLKQVHKFPKLVVF